MKIKTKLLIDYDSYSMYRHKKKQKTNKPLLQENNEVNLTSKQAKMQTNR